MQDPDRASCPSARKNLWRLVGAHCVRRRGGSPNHESRKEGHRE